MSKELHCVNPACRKLFGEVMKEILNIMPSEDVKILTKPALQIKCPRCKTWNMITST
jgi:hypothetical protein